MWILIIFWLANNGKALDKHLSPIAITNIEFNSLEKCKIAQDTLMKANIPGDKYYLCAKK